MEGLKNSKQKSSQKRRKWITLIRSFLKRKERTTYYWKIRTDALNKSGGMKYIAMYRHKKLMRENCADIPFTASIADMPTFPHGLNGIFISAGATIGSGCTIFHQVTIGSNTLPDSKNKGTPTIGDNVYIGCGAKIIGNVKVGNIARIGANCVVTRDVPANSTVILSSPRVIIHEEILQNKFIPFGSNKKA